MYTLKTTKYYLKEKTEDFLSIEDLLRHLESIARDQTTTVQVIKKDGISMSETRKKVLLAIALS